MPTSEKQQSIRGKLNFTMDALRRYFRLEVEGIENIPRQGAALITPNHSGFSGLDALLLSREIHLQTDRIPRVLTHYFWFMWEATRKPAQKIGFIEANTDNGLKHLSKNNLVVLFPEGEAGNFKPSLKRYHLQEFKRGFVRMALQAQCPIIPTLIIGAEESNLNWTQLRIGKLWKGLTLPLPFNLIPFPARWKIIFLPQIRLPYHPDAARDNELVHEIAQDVREAMQLALSQEVKRRKRIF